MAAIFQTTFSKWIFLNENIWISLKVSLTFFFTKVRINNILELVQTMVGAKPLSEPMMVSLLTHICVARPQWVYNWKSQPHPPGDNELIQCFWTEWPFCWRFNSSRWLKRNNTHAIFPMSFNISSAIIVFTQAMLQILQHIILYLANVRRDNFRRTEFFHGLSLHPSWNNLISDQASQTM